MPSTPSNAIDEQAKRITLVIPARNRPALLKNCLIALCEQEFPLEKCEVLVCDDGSSEDLSTIIDTYRAHIPKIRLLKQPPKGPAAARNLGFRSSNAEIFICVDCDVICDKRFLTELIKGFDDHPGWVAIEATVTPTGGSASPLWDGPASRGGVFISAASAYRKDALRRAGGFDESFLLAACEDTDLAARLLDIGEYGYIPGAIAYHPRRRVTLGRHWEWRKHWKYIMILAERYGFLGFPGSPVGRFPRLRVAISALINIPAKRFIEGARYTKTKPSEGLLASTYALFDIFCGLAALPAILFSPVPPARNYLIIPTDRSGCGNTSARITETAHLSA